MIPELADAMLATGGVICVCFVVLLIADRLARLIKRF